MNSYYIVFGVIIALAILNYVGLFWILWLQKKLRQATHNPVKSDSVAAASGNAASEPPAVGAAEHTAALQAKAEHLLEEKLQKTADQFQSDLAKTASLVNQHVSDLSDKVIQDELVKYQNALDEVRQASVDTLSEVQHAIDKQRVDMEKALAVQVAEEKQRILDRFSTSIGEIVSGYLVETLGQNVDLGAQSSYIFATLEEHKEELKKAISSGP